MVLQSSGKISLNEIATEFGGSAPHSISEYYKGGSNVPTTLSSSVTQAAPSTNATYTDFASVTGLTLVRSATSTAVEEIFFMGSGPSGAVTKATSIDTLTALNGRGRDDSGTFTITGTAGTNTRSFGSGGTIPTNAGPTGIGNGPFTIQATEPVDTRLNYSRAGVNYSFTNNTGFDVVVESTTISNGATASVSPSGDYNITFTISVNANIPTSGKVAMTDFYSGRKT